MQDISKTVASSMVNDQVYWVFPNDLNANDTVFGGMIMAQMDRLCAVVGCRHAESICVTVSVDAVHFLAPAKRGDVLIFAASVNKAWRTSMEVGCRVDAQALNGERRHILSAYFTFVSVDVDGKPNPVPLLITETDEERRRSEEAELRRSQRLRHADEMKAFRAKAKSKSQVTLAEMPTPPVTER